MGFLLLEALGSAHARARVAQPVHGRDARMARVYWIYAARLWPTDATGARLAQPPHANTHGRRQRGLSTIHLFRGLTPRGLERIAAIAGEEVHERGTRVFREGEMGDKLYLFLEGKVRISRNLAGMGEEALAVLGPARRSARCR